MSKTVLFQTMQFSSIWPIDKTLSGATTPGQSGLGSHGNVGVLCILQSSSITRTSPSDCLVSYPGHLRGGVLSLCREAVSVFYSPSQLGKKMFFSCLKLTFLEGRLFEFLKKLREKISLNHFK